MPAYRVEFLPSAARDLASLPRTIQRRLGHRLDALTKDPRPEGVKALKETERLLRLRVGDYRIIYRVDDHRRSVHVVKIGHRREVYRKR